MSDIDFPHTREEVLSLPIEESGVLGLTPAHRDAPMGYMDNKGDCWVLIKTREGFKRQRINI